MLGDPRELPAEGSERVSLVIHRATLLRLKTDGVLEHLLGTRGGAASFAWQGADGWIETEGGLADLEVALTSGKHFNRLDGSEPTVRLAAGITKRLGEERSLMLAMELGSRNLTAFGQTPSILSGIPGFIGTEPVRLEWNEDALTLALRHHWSDDAWLQGAVTSSRTAIRWEGASGRDALTLATRPAGETFQLAGSLPIGEDWLVRGVGEWMDLSDTGRVLLNGEPIGPVRASEDAQRYSVELSPSGSPIRWTAGLHWAEGEYAFSGSALLTGFSSSVFGVSAPRGHLETAARLRELTLTYDTRGGHWGPIDLAYGAGLTHWTLEGGARSYGTVLFGSVPIDERFRPLELESGLLLHVQLGAQWALEADARFELAVGQTIPLVMNTRDDEVTEPGPEHERAFDGGRLVELRYVVEF